MRVETLHGVQLDVCLHCGGIWFDSLELKRLLSDDASIVKLEGELASTVQHAPAGPSAYLCPDDYRHLEEYHYLYSSPAVLHTCPDCGGFWIAHEDLAEIRRSFGMRHDTDRPSDAAAIAVAEFSMEHDREMHKQAGVLRLMKLLRATWPLYLDWWR